MRKFTTFLTAAAFAGSLCLPCAALAIGGVGAGAAVGGISGGAGYTGEVGTGTPSMNAGPFLGSLNPNLPYAGANGWEGGNSNQPARISRKAAMQERVLTGANGAPPPPRDPSGRSY
jgi:hypothetical protein